MNILQKVTVAALLTGFALVSNPARADVLGVSITLPTASTVAGEVTKIVATDVAASLRNALREPRVTRVRQSPSVTVEQMETVLVVATRLPAAQSLAARSDR